MNYGDMLFKIPIESPDYAENSNLIITMMQSILRNRILRHENKIVLNTNLRYGLPLENINKIAGPIVEAWAFETFVDVSLDLQNPYYLIHVEA